MERKKYNITKEQQEFRNKILNKKSVIPDKPKLVYPPKTTTIQYMENCIYWIKNYISSGENKKAIQSAEYLQVHCKSIIQELTNNAL